MKRILVLFAFLILGEQIYPQVWKPVGAGLNGEVYALLHDSVPVVISHSLDHWLLIILQNGMAAHGRN
ncbi:MAG: hypothetical protein US50_C0059G0004 [Candidatus Nomurabacteria bacterium GW2011_GWB1_37_5]|uniref:Uncharacterized protein n=1 Tax=Candidatus Nomurabacteria bacterium GW2011_GWB1_37_5 TaxID=1618742 RepID=A0A0G0K0L7_9BACT|nr:MAG: hypothetical protein US50_C0059G0004 [Candidatus Nomurabacteria bacterium GW2011_GWB1_37_5]